MAITWYIARGGSDNNSGSRVSTSAYASGTGASTSGTTTVSLLADNPDLSGVVDSQDTIRINGVVRGLYSSDIYKITAHNNTAGVKTVTISSASPAVGSPVTATGQTWAIGGSFATPTRACNVVNADGSEEIRICAGDNTGSDSLALNGSGCTTARAATNSNAPIKITGCNTSGTPYAGSAFAMIEDTGSTSAFGINANSAHNFYWARDIHLYNLSGSITQQFTAGTSWRVEHCKVESCSGGFKAGGHGSFIDCTALNNTGGYGFQDRAEYIRCIALWTSGGISATGFYITSNATTAIGAALVDCLVHGTEGIGVDIINSAAATGIVIIKNCTLDGCATGIQIDYGFNNQIIHIRNNLISNNSSYGVLVNSGTGYIILESNHFDSNGTDVSGSTTTDDTKTSGDPQFVDRANHDFHITRFSSAARWDRMILSSYAGCYAPYLKKHIQTG